MKHLLLATLLATTAAPTQAGFFDLFDEFSKESQDHMEKWAKRFGPSLEAFGPKIDALLDKVDDWTMYELPEVLENGDIIMRRKQPAEPEKSETPEPKNPSIDL